FSVFSCRDPRELLPFPTRRSSDLLEDGVILVQGEGLEAPGAFVGGKTHIVALGQGQVVDLAGVLGEVAAKEVGQHRHGGALQALHGGGHKGIVGVALGFADVVLIHVHAHDHAFILHSRFHGRAVDAAAAGEDDLGAALVPALHLGGDGRVGGEGVAVGVLHVHGDAQLLGCGVGALDEAVAVALHGGHGDAAQEAQLGVAVLHHSVAGQVAGLLLGEGEAGGLRAGHGAAQVALAHVDGDEVSLVAVEVLRLAQGGAEEVAGHDDDVIAVGNGGGDGNETSVVGILGGLVVVVLHAVGLAELHHALPGGLVEGLVVDGAHVGNQGDLGVVH